MDYYSMTDSAIAKELGSRIRGLRLRKNITQRALAESVGVSLNAVKSLESGKGKLSTLIAVFRGLDALDSFDLLIPEIQISPVQLAKRQGQLRVRATGTRSKNPSKKGSDEW